MKSRLKIQHLAIVATILLNSCGVEDPGDLQPGDKTFTFANFEKVEAGSALKVTISQGDAFSVNAHGDIRNLDELDIYQSGSVLKVGFNDHRSRRHDTYVDITMPSALSVKISGASDANITGFDEDTFDLFVSGASKTNIDVAASSMNLEVSGASQVELSGTVSEFNVNVSGASGLRAYSMMANNAHVYASGASDVQVRVDNNLFASASGASTIIYDGSPTVTVNSSGSSSVHHR